MKKQRGWSSLGDVTDLDTRNGGLTVQCGSASVQITLAAGGIIRVRLAPTGRFGRLPSCAVVESTDGEPRPYKVRERGERIDLISENVLVRIGRRPCRIAFHSLDAEPICADDPALGMTWCGEEVAAWKALHPEDHFFGLGEKGLPFDKRDTAVVNWNLDAAHHGPWSDPLYQSHPFLIALNGGRAYGLFFDNTYRSWFDLGKTSRHRFGFGADGGALDYYFIPGPTPEDVVRRYTRLVGRPPLPPMWALGYQQCRWSYGSAARIRRLAREFRRRKIPCDAIYIDIDYMDGFRCFTWDARRFKHPARLMRDLKRDGFKAVVILDPGIKKEPGYSVFDAGRAGDHFCRGADGRPYVGRVWPGETVFPDFSQSRTRQWWGDLYRNLVDTGVTGFWNDMNEPADFSQPDGVCPLTMQHGRDGDPTDHRGVHNVYGMQMARATFEGVRRLRPDERPFVLTRAGYAGVQRYSAVWTGDNRSTWEHLQMSLPMLLNMSVSGITFCGADIGGFFDVPSGELFARWLQLGVFYPLMRTHTCGGPEQDPWGYGPKFEAINRRTIELRYRLLPYIYAEFQNAIQDGLPLLRPLWMDYPTVAGVHQISDQFMFGRQLLAAPVLVPGATRRKVMLPPGDWFDLADGTRRRGGEPFELPVKLDTIPIFARAGAVIPTRRVVQHTEAGTLEELRLLIFPGSGFGSFYHDDGRSHDYQHGAFVSESYETRSNGSGRRLIISRQGEAERLGPRCYRLFFMGCEKPVQAVTIGRRPWPACRSRSALRRRQGGWFYDARSRRLEVTAPAFEAHDAVSIRYRKRSRRK